MPAWRDSSWQIDKLDPVYAVSKGNFLYEPMRSGSVHINPALCRISPCGEDWTNTSRIAVGRHTNYTGVTVVA